LIPQSEQLPKDSVTRMADDFHEIVLSVRHLTTKLKVKNNIFNVVDDLSFDLYRGKTLAIVGESGCGKSMSALSLMRILPKPPFYKSQGEVLFQGQNLLKLSEKKMRQIRGGKIAMIFQDPHSALNPVFTIGDQLTESCNIHRNLWGNEAFDEVILALDEVGIKNPKDRFYAYPHELSGGMKQRVMIAMALIGQPDILIADEPTTALDSTIQTQVLDLIKDLQKKRGMAVLLITHDMGVVLNTADECMVMYAAECIEKGKTQEVFSNPSHPYTQALLKARPTYKIKRGELEAIKGVVPQLVNLPSWCRFHPRCPYSMPICLEGQVDNFVIKNDNENSHIAKCWLRK
jgi:peptide/nickel transport system ATP-binding protein